MISIRVLTMGSIEDILRAFIEASTRLSTEAIIEAISNIEGLLGTSIIF